MFKKILSFYVLTIILITSVNLQTWSIDKTQTWYSQQDWLVGCNFIPSTAENTIEMWQDETFDPITIDKELKFAENIGFNIIRVFLHYLVWQQNPNGFKQRLDKFLDIAISHKIKTMFVFFDDCWNKEAHLGIQEPPIPGVHSPWWVQCPGWVESTNTTLFPIFKNYIQDIMSYYSSDKRVLLWDIYNEPGNFGHYLNTLPLLKNAFEWAREVNASQPLTTALWYFYDDFESVIQFQLQNSDIITFHNYDEIYTFLKLVEKLKGLANGRPIVCSEYMARTMGSLFETHLPLMKWENIGAINWGLVSGRSQTIFPWDSLPYSPTPKIWFHDIFYPNGTSFNASETILIKNLILPEN